MSELRRRAVRAPPLSKSVWFLFLEFLDAKFLNYRAEKSPLFRTAGFSHNAPRELRDPIHWSCEQSHHHCRGAGAEPSELCHFRWFRSLRKRRRWLRHSASTKWSWRSGFSAMTSARRPWWLAVFVFFSWDLFERRLRQNVLCVFWCVLQFQVLKEIREILGARRAAAPWLHVILDLRVCFIYQVIIWPTLQAYQAAYERVNMQVQVQNTLKLERSKFLGATAVFFSMRANV